MREYQVDYSRYSFKAEDDWGDYDNGKPREGYFDKEGYCCHSYLCNDGKFHTFFEHIAKWEYFNGRIPEGLKVDHKIPVKKGGTNNISNLRIGTQKFNMNNEYTIETMQKCHKDTERNKKISDKLKGKKKTEEHRIKAAKGHEKKIYQYTKELILVKIWDNAEETKKYGYCKKNVQRCCRKERKTHKGYIWSYIPL